MKLRHIPAALLLLTLPTLALAKGWVKDPNTGCEIWTNTADAASWDGACVGGKASGNGTITYKKDGSKYEGDVEDGKTHGQGVYVFGSGEFKGDRYEGQFKDGKFNGQGVYVWKDGRRYEGAWENNQRHGLGKMTNADGSLFHEGQWANGQPVQVAAAPAPAPAPARSTACDHVYVGKEFDSKLGMYWLKFHWRVQGVNPNTGRATVRTNEIDSGKSEEVSCGSIP